ncbi:2-haloacrylate reductase [Pseudomonas reidholzensis]|uniref:NADPH:quinone reductase n=1 Tax=Pseudomonas reidholzensis TaxID=1785162 RepID=A0A383RU69_9PSED|nr:quinone oxidoreductase [Pseudomonas reidholzensis]SYX90582.1 2-haloacrylate reductase [Pseudomonas reidholzensis]
MEHATRIHAYGGPEVLTYEPVDVGAPGPGELKLRQTFVGVNFHDVYVRSGSYRTLSLPGIPGLEGVGYVEQIGAGVTGFQVGDRVIYLSSKYGAYATSRLVSAEVAIPLPSGISEADAAACYLKGLTVQMLLHKLSPVRPGSWVLIHAAAGGVGQLLVQGALKLGANVIGTVGSPEKADLLRKMGCKHTILYREVDFVEAVHSITEQRGVDIVFDSVGKDTFAGSLEVLTLRGSLINFGQASGAIAPVDVSTLAAKSLTLSRPIIFHYLTRRADLEELSGLLFQALLDGDLRVEPPITFALKDAHQAHALLESRKTAQSIVLRV